MLAVLLPSRGLVHSRVIEALDRELKGVLHKRFYTHNQPIPDCFTQLVENSLRDGPFTHFWFVEEDIVPPSGALQSLYKLNTDIAFVDYPLVKFPAEHCFKVIQGKLVWVGLGCTLVKRQVFTEMELPWFDCGYNLVAIFEGSSHKSYRLDLQPKSREKNKNYGGQDIYFCAKAFFSGYTIDIVPKVQCEHLS